MPGNAEDRYTYQGGFVKELLGGAQYDIFFGAFGTGILGVKKLLANNTLSPDPADHYIILFVNVQGCGLSVVSTSSMNTFHNDSLDKERKVLRWYSQACDRESTKAQFIIDHANAGSPVVIATRRNASGDFSLLGKPRQLQMVKEAHLSTAVGDMLLEIECDDVSSDKYHKAISANCFSFPKKLSALKAIKATEEILTSRRICIRCCVIPASVDMIFDEMQEDGLAMFEEEDANRRRKLVKKKPASARPDKGLTRVSKKVEKAQQKAEIAAKRDAKKLQKPEADNLEGNEASLGKLVEVSSRKSSEKDRRRRNKSAPDAERVVEPYQPEIAQNRRRLRGRTELLPSEIASLPPLPNGMPDILDGMMIHAKSSASDAVEVGAVLVETPAVEPSEDVGTEVAGRERGILDILEEEESPFGERLTPIVSVENEAGNGEVKHVLADKGLTEESIEAREDPVKLTEDSKESTEESRVENLENQRIEEEGSSKTRELKNLELNEESRKESKDIPDIESTDVSKDIPDIESISKDVSEDIPASKEVSEDIPASKEVSEDIPASKEVSEDIPASKEVSNEDDRAGEGKIEAGELEPSPKRAKTE